MDISQLNYSQIIIDTLNQLFNTLFSSIDDTLFNLLDDVVFIDTSIISDSFFEKAFGSTYHVGIILIADSLLLGFIIYYSVKLFLSFYTGSNIEKPYQFVFKSIIFALCINYSPFLCEMIIHITSLICSSIKEVGAEIFGIQISFHTLIKQINSFISTESFNLFSIDGIIKSFVSIGLMNLLFSFSLRYILLKVFILLSPFAFLSLITISTSWFFKIWLKNFLSLLLLQSFISMIFLILFSFDGTFSSSFSQLMYVGCIYALTKANYYMREIIGGISTDFNVNISSLKSFLK